MAFGNPITRWVYNRSPAALQNVMATLYSRGRGLKKFGPKFTEYLSELKRIQWYSQDELHALQQEKLRRLVWHACHFVPYYRRSFNDLSIAPQEITRIEALASIPLLEKNEVQLRKEEFRSSLYLDPKAVEVIHSSGTTGKAIDVYVAKDYLKLEKAFLWLQRAWLGLQPGDRTAYFTGFPIVPLSRKRPPFWVHDTSENRMLFSLQHMSEENLPFYAEKLGQFNPELLVGYPTAIYLMAQHIADKTSHCPRPRGIFTASETLLPHQRAVIESAFDTRVMDLYGQAEYCGMVMQCEAGSYHIQDQYGVMEILSRDGQATPTGEIGEIVCKGLNNLAMPFIRYRTGDTAIPKAGRCSCGRGGSLVERITGRMEDVLITPDGRYLSRMDFVFKEIRAVEEAQLVQESGDLLRIRVVRRPEFTEKDQAKIERNLRERIGREMRFEFEFLPRIPRAANGKFRYVVSKVPLGPGPQVGDFRRLRQEEETTLRS